MASLFTTATTRSATATSVTVPRTAALGEGAATWGAGAWVADAGVFDFPESPRKGTQPGTAQPARKRAAPPATRTRTFMRRPARRAGVATSRARAANRRARYEHRWCTRAS